MSDILLAESVMQVAKYGTPEQVNAVQALLTKANQDVHAVAPAVIPSRWSIRISNSRSRASIAGA